MKTARVGVSTRECCNVPTEKRFELEKSFKLRDSTNSIERKKVMIQNKNTHLSMKEFSKRPALQLTQTGSEHIAEDKLGTRSNQQTAYLREFMCLLSFPAPDFG